MKTKKVIGIFLIYLLVMLAGSAPVYASATPILTALPAANESQAVSMTKAGGSSALSSSVQTTNVSSTDLSLGDSIAYGMSATPGNDYVDLWYNHLQTISTYSQLSLNNLAVSGDTSSNLLARLQTSQYTTAVSNAKIITLSIGGDNLLSPVIGAVCTAFGVNPVNNPNLTSDLAKAMANNPNKDMLLASLVNSPALIQTLQSGVSQFSTDFPQIIGTLKTLSPQAKIYVLNLYNPFSTQDPLYKVFDPLISGINQVLKTGAAAGYQVADVYTKFKATPGAVNFNLAQMQLDPHPTTVGHAAIYQAILDAESGQLPATYYTVSIGTLSGGSVTASAISATPGTTIMLTVSPDPGRQLQAGTLKYNDGTADHLISNNSFILPAANVTVTASFEQIDFPPMYNIPSDKIWTIVFNQELDLSLPLKNYISVTDSQNSAVPISILSTFGNSGRCIILNPPPGGYTSGRQYVLTISKGLKSRTGAILSKPIQMTFTVK
jgi:lysophospholipase L1-like esterase